MKKKLSLRNSIDEAMKEDCRSAGHTISVNSESSDEPAAKIRKVHEAFVKAHGPQTCKRVQPLKSVVANYASTKVVPRVMARTAVNSIEPEKNAEQAFGDDSNEIRSKSFQSSH